MPNERSASQKVETFTASVDLLRAAQMEAKSRRMTKSGFYRYCLAKELGISEEEALQIAEHASVGKFSIVQSQIGGTGNTQTNVGETKKRRTANHRT